MNFTNSPSIMYTLVRSPAVEVYLFEDFLDLIDHE